MKTIWRRECIDPCNTFFVQPMSSVSICVDALQPLILGAVQASPFQAAQYMRHAPKLASMRKRVADTDDKIQRMMRLERNLRLSLMGNELDVSSSVDLFEDELLLPAPMPTANPPQDAVVVSTPCRMLAQPVESAQPVQSAQPVKSAQSIQAVKSAQPISTSMSQIVRATTLIGSPSRHISVVSTYNELIRRLVVYDVDNKVMVTRQEIVTRFSDHARLFISNAMLSGSVALEYLLNTMGISGSVQLLVKSTLAAWMRRLCDTQDDPVAVYVGFYVAPTIAVYRDLYTSTLLPLFITQCTHRIEADYDRALHRAKNAVKPVVVAYFKPTTGSMVLGLNILPLGVVSGSAS